MATSTFWSKERLLGTVDRSSSALHSADSLIGQVLMAVLTRMRRNEQALHCAQLSASASMDTCKLRPSRIHHFDRFVSLHQKPTNEGVRCHHQEA